MASKYRTFLSKLFNSEKPPTQEQLQGLMHETVAFFQEIRKALETNDEKAAEAALKELTEVKGVLEGTLKKIAEKTGIDAEQLTKLAQNLMPPEQRERLKKLSEQAHEEGRIAALAHTAGI